MTRNEFVKFLDDSNADENTRIFALNCFASGQKSMRKQLSDDLLKMPVNDTAASIAIWIRGQE